MRICIFYLQSLHEQDGRITIDSLLIKCRVCNREPQQYVWDKTVLLFCLFDDTDFNFDIHTRDFAFFVECAVDLPLFYSETGLVSKIIVSLGSLIFY